MEFNVNQKVRIRLTKRGRDILDRNEFGYTGFRPVEGGYHEVQLWDLMQTLGQHMVMGLPVPFETTIELMKD